MHTGNTSELCRGVPPSNNNDAVDDFFFCSSTRGKVHCHDFANHSGEPSKRKRPVQSYTVLQRANFKVKLNFLLFT